MFVENTSAVVDLQTYIVDAAHSQVRFSVRHLGFSKVRGQFNSFDGTVRMSANELDSLQAAASVDIASITTGDDKRDAHLRSDDFFDAENHPSLTFESTGVRDISGTSCILDGRLTIRGTSKPVALETEWLGEVTDPWGGARVALEATTTINRKEFGLNWNQMLEAGGVLVGENVEITLEIQAVRQDEREES